MSKIKLIATDLDGTLLQSDHTLSEVNLGMWHTLKDLGIHLIPVTGRTLNSIKNCIPQELIEYTVNVNGVKIFQYKEERILEIWDKSLDSQIAIEVLKFLKEHYPTYHVQFYIDEDLYASEENERTREYTMRSGIRYNIVQDFNEISGKRVSKIMILEEHEELIEVQKSLLMHHAVNVMFSMPNYLEVFSKEANKGLAILYIADLLDIQSSDILSIGDSYNDIPMLEVSGTAYLMKNSFGKLAPEIPRTVYTNDEDGVAKLVYSLLEL